jgi:hypothetical protein
MLFLLIGAYYKYSNLLSRTSSKVGVRNVGLEIIVNS